MKELLEYKIAQRKAKTPKKSPKNESLEEFKRLKAKLIKEGQLLVLIDDKSIIKSTIASTPILEMDDENLLRKLYADSKISAKNKPFIEQRISEITEFKPMNITIRGLCDAEKWSKVLGAKSCYVKEEKNIIYKKLRLYLKALFCRHQAQQRFERVYLKKYDRILKKMMEFDYLGNQLNTSNERAALMRYALEIWGGGERL